MNTATQAVTECARMGWPDAIVAIVGTVVAGVAIVAYIYFLCR